jgi:hypothetical protein
MFIRGFQINGCVQLFLAQSGEKHGLCKWLVHGLIGLER